MVALTRWLLRSLPVLSLLGACSLSALALASWQDSAALKDHGSAPWWWDPSVCQDRLPRSLLDSHREGVEERIKNVLVPLNPLCALAWPGFWVRRNDPAFERPFAARYLLILREAEFERSDHGLMRQALSWLAVLMGARNREIAVQVRWLRLPTTFEAPEDLPDFGIDLVLARSRVRELTYRGEKRVELQRVAAEFPRLMLRLDADCWDERTVSLEVLYEPLSGGCAPHLAANLCAGPRRNQEIWNWYRRLHKILESMAAEAAEGRASDCSWVETDGLSFAKLRQPHAPLEEGVIFKAVPDRVPPTPKEE